MKKWRTLIVDDEPMARARVRRLLSNDPSLEIIGECEDGFQAVETIRAVKPDLLLLDIQMPGKDGFAVLAEIPAEQMPVTIFLTAYDLYAVRAFEVCALDYLLKPYDENRFAKALQRAKATLANTSSNSAPEPLVAPPPPNAPLERLLVKTNGRVLVVPTAKIDWVESCGNYVQLHVEKNRWLLRETMEHLEAQLDPQQFVRIHRTTLVNITRIAELQPATFGQYVVRLHSGAQLTLSRRYRRKLQRLRSQLF
jgi:two-component system LytT family response regulator